MGTIIRIEIRRECVCVCIWVCVCVLALMQKLCSSFMISPAICYKTFEWWTTATATATIQVSAIAIYFTL